MISNDSIEVWKSELSIKRRPDKQSTNAKLSAGPRRAACWLSSSHDQAMMVVTMLWLFSCLGHCSYSSRHLINSSVSVASSELKELQCGEFLA